MFISTANVPSGNCIANQWFADAAGAQQAACPAAVTADTYTTELKFLLGPVPASGASVSNLEAVGNTAVTGTQTYTVDVTDNTTGTTLLACTVSTSSLSTTACRNTGSAAVTAGHYLEVKISKANGPADAQWRVSFRY